jgi:Fe2+ transport system protein FeoA
MVADTLVPLEYLEVGEWAEIAEVAGEPAAVQRLAEFGVRCGCRIHVLQAGSPCLLQLGGVRLSLRSDLATHVLAQPLGRSEPQG